MNIKTRNDIGDILSAMGLNRWGVEVGVAFGEHAEAILQRSCLYRLYLVDPWAYVPGENAIGYADAIKDWDGCYEFCKAKMAPYGRRPSFMRCTSRRAAAAIPDGSLDFVYIDANHMRPYIDNDLQAWYPKVRAGGIFGGHDYHMVNTPYYQCHVKDAVDEFIAGRHTIHTTTEDADPSWYIIKA